MMSPISTETMMKQFALRLRNADRASFDDFISALDTYTIEVMGMLTRAPPDAILNMQGRAQQCHALLRVLNECHKTPQAPTSAP